MEKETILGLGLVGVGAYLLLAQPQEQKIGGGSGGGGFGGFLSGLGSFAPLQTTKTDDGTEQPVYNVLVEAPEFPTDKRGSVAPTTTTKKVSSGATYVSRMTPILKEKGYTPTEIERWGTYTKKEQVCIAPELVPEPPAETPEYYGGKPYYEW